MAKLRVAFSIKGYFLWIIIVVLQRPITLSVQLFLLRVEYNLKMYEDRNLFIKSSGARLVIRLTFFFVLYWAALNFHPVQSHNFSPGQARIRFCSDASKKGHRLNATVYDDRHSLSRIDCVVQCVYEPCCRSINYRKRDPFNGKENCELLHAVASEQPAEDLKEDKDYDYEILLEPNKPFDCQVCSSCKNNGSCETSKKLCSCDSGFNGTQCEKDINECSLSSNRCHQNSTCQNTVGSYTCTCNQGFTGNGVNCTDVDECGNSNPCHQNSTCKNTVGSYTCPCNQGFTGNGTNCADVDECSSGSNLCHKHSTCNNTVGSYTCTCNQGFAGNGINCPDIDECKSNSNDCHQNSNNNDCNNTVGSYTCKCNCGFTGDGINCTDVDECSSKPCNETFSCNNTVGSYSCKPASGNEVPRSCADLYKSGVKENGVYTIDPDDEGVFDVWCDMTTDQGGWTVFQRRIDGSVDFYRDWSDYKHGFGHLSCGEFWLGLDKINRLTESGQNVLRVVLEDFEGETRYAKYQTFAVANESRQYNLTVEGYSGNAGDSLEVHNGMKFTTNDNDNDNKKRENCAVKYKGAWWYKQCHNANLNGLYLRGPNTKAAQGVIWWHWKGSHYSLKKSEIKVRS